MREIKFRFWSKTLGYFVKPDDSIFVGALKDKNMAVMQFTGLKDKNGKEIYEGDVVELKRKQVNGDIHRFVVEWDEMKAGFCLTLVHMYPKRQDSYIRNEFINAKNKTVIGNIYENPELLVPPIEEEKEKV